MALKHWIMKLSGMALQVVYSMSSNGLVHVERHICSVGWHPHAIMALKSYMPFKIPPAALSRVGSLKMIDDTRTSIYSDTS